jgi:site-specific recombinase XerD
MRANPLPERRLVPVPALLREDLAAAEEYARAALAPSTWKAYASDWRIFEAWCRERDVNQMPASPTAVAAFLASEAKREFAAVTIERRAAAIAFVHRSRNEPNPCDSAAVSTVLSGIRRKRGTAPQRQVRPLQVKPLELLVGAIDQASKQGKRDRALLLLGFAAALRRSELVALDVTDLAFDVDRGLLVKVRASKTDQEKAGEIVAVPFASSGSTLCAVRAVSAWLSAGGIREGAVFRRMRRGDNVTGDRLTAQSVALTVKKVAEAAGLDEDQVGELAGHSLRAGYITAAAAAGVEERKIANVSRHRNLPVLRSYIRNAQAFDEVGNVL